MHIAKQQLSKSEIQSLLESSVKSIAPLWSLENFVAVNPYLGLADKDFGSAMSFLNKTGGIQATLPVSFYAKALIAGQISRKDISDVLEDNIYGIDNDVDDFIKHIINYDESDEADSVKTMSDLASSINGKRWGRFMEDRISFWASTYFDKNQAIWNTASKDTSVFTAWKREAEIDFSTEAMGLSGFRKFIKNLPDNYLESASKVLKELNLPESTLDHYLTSVLIKMNGWAGFTARIDWDAKLTGQKSHATEEFLTIMLVWELALKELLKYPNLDQVWERTKYDNIENIRGGAIKKSFARKLILQEAFDRANQRSIISKINDNRTQIKKVEKRPLAQAIFCIDVRSELYRRNLEAANDSIETLGFAGFFGFPINYKRVAHDKGTDQCPVLLKPTHTINESFSNEQEETKALENRSIKEQVLKAWKSFKLGAISCFSFVSPLGLFFLPKLLTDAFSITRPLSHPDTVGLTREQIKHKRVNINESQLEGISPKDRLQMAKSALTAMSLTENFAKTVIIAGHGSSTVNNPHATGLDCGACGGSSGEANAKVAATVLNDPQVREGLKEANINVPNDTIFVAALHNTTTDELTLFEPSSGLPYTHDTDLPEIKYALKLAGESSRKERAGRMNINSGDLSKKVIQRSKDWSQVRPEWGLAGCSSFIVAPRYRTANLNMGAKAFMHSYDWHKDKDFGVLEAIMTAPMVVTSWINLQYYASTVDNKNFGAGNKTLHNVVGGLGVLEGFSGDLRVGLPLQSVHDGEKFQHEPQRLNVIIEAPVDEMSKVLEKHESIRNLCDNEWIYLVAMNEDGKVAFKYIGDLEWEVC